eukprot:SAG31_NODE_10638_length_1114_cov_1.662069_1_plen_99_part_00
MVVYMNSTYASLQYVSHLIITHILNIIQNSEHCSEILWSFTRSGLYQLHLSIYQILLLILNIIQNSEHFSEILWSFTRSGPLPATSDHLSDFLTTKLE